MMSVNVPRCNSFLGLQLSAQEMCTNLQRMCFEATEDQPTTTKQAQSHAISSSPSQSQSVCVRVGPTRHDVLHECDLIEDVGIAYGFNNIKHTLPKSLTVGAQVCFTSPYHHTPHHTKDYYSTTDYGCLHHDPTPSATPIRTPSFYSITLLWGLLFNFLQVGLVFFNSIVLDGY